MRPLLACAVAAAALAVGAGVSGVGAATRTCAPRVVGDAYAASVQQAVASGRDLWGARLLRARGGPTYATAAKYLAPLERAVQWHGRTLTPSGSYYLPLSFAFTSYGPAVYALHVADGSEIVTRRVGGPSLQIYTGSGRERYGSCPSRLTPARLAEGHVPILQTAYVDAGGVRYRQESFAGRAYGSFGARSVVSFVRLVVDARTSKHGATVRLVPWQRLAHTAPDRLAEHGRTRLIVSTDDAQFVDGVVRYRVPAGERRVIYADWLNAPSEARYVHADAAAYDAARAAVVAFWRQKLAAGAQFQVPERTVQDAEQAILAQLIAYGWRYSIGNPYEELSYAESLDAAEIAAEYGYPAVAKSIIEFALQRMRIRPWRFTAFRGGHLLATSATYYRLTRDRAFLRAETPELERLVARIAERRVRSGPAKGRLQPEPLSTDLENRDVDSVSGQVEAVEALLSIGRVWSSAGYPGAGKRARALAVSIDAALRPAVARASKRLRDGSLFVPDELGGQRPFGRLTATREGSYWNLVMPYAFASGWFPAHSRQARGALRYVLAHGSRLLGVPRTYARTVYGDEPGAGLAPVYALGWSRFLADNDQPDQLVLSLYGLLAAGMTHGTYVSGEAVSVLPVRGAYERSMFMPPNSGSNASYLGTLRELLVHERRGRLGAPAGLDLAFSTPRAWLADGQQIEVRSAPTSFGKVSYTLVRHGSTIDGSLLLPPRCHCRLRLRVPAGERPAHVVVGATVVAANGAGTIDLGDRHGRVEVRATLRASG
ncbi:MAG TPA: hypothetical protein VFU56_07070 [Gaiellaceae bacterium]|nr:hypothetical protein [Gaiellaceae bacterium]